MINCVKCGNQIKENNKFCQVCGTPVANNTTSEPTTQKVSPQKTTSQKTTPQKPKKEVDEKTKKKRKFLTILVIVVLVTGFTAYKVGESMTSKDKVIERFITAITEKDLAELSRLVKSSDPRLEVSEESLKPFIDYIDENPSYLDSLTTSIQEQSENQNQPVRNNNKNVPSFSKKEDTNIISLNKKGKKFVFYDNYQLEIQPFFARIDTNYKDAIIYINDKEIGVSDSENFTKEFGPFVPGKYTIKSVYTGEYATIENKKPINLITDYYDSNSKILYFGLYLDGRYIYADTNFYDGKILINGKDSGLTPEEMNISGLGPVDDTTKIQLSRDFPWGNITSEEVIVGESQSYIDLYIDPMNQGVKDQIMEAVNTYVNDHIQVLNSRDVSKYTNITGKQLDDIKNTIQDRINWEEMFNGISKSIIYNLDSMRLYSQNGEYFSEISGLFYYEGVNYYEGYEVPDMTERVDRMKYSLKYDESSKKWMIYKVDYQYYFDDTNTKEFNFEK